MSDATSSAGLGHEHGDKAIRERIEEEPGGYLGDTILGSIDGVVTTFAVVAGAVGGGLGARVVVVLGIAKLLADGFSMGVSNYLQAKSESERVEQARREERRHIDEVPEGERQEVREIFAQKGFEGQALEQIVEIVTDQRQMWVDTMLVDELGLCPEGRRPSRAGLATFLSFLVVGAVPLVPFLVPGLTLEPAFMISAVVAGLAFVGVGIAKGMVLDRALFRSAVETLLIGGGAAILAYLVGLWLRETYGV